MLVYADTAANNCPSTAGDTSCDFAVFARNYTLDPTRASGEFGQDFPGFPASLGVDSSVIAYLPQISDDAGFRTNVGVASWTNDWVTVREDIQDTSGNIIGRYDHLIPPNGHEQWRLEVGGLTGGTVAVYIAGRAERRDGLPVRHGRRQHDRGRRPRWRRRSARSASRRRPPRCAPSPRGRYPGLCRCRASRSRRLKHRVR